MEKEFIPYDRALKMKELGFNEECFGFYNPTVTKKVIMNNDSYGGYGLSHEHIILAPTFSQAFRWFREKYDIISVIYRVGDDYVFGFDTTGAFNNNPTYEEAELKIIEGEERDEGEEVNEEIEWGTEILTKTKFIEDLEE